MLAMLRNYFLMVLIKIVIASVIFGLCLLAIFTAYWFFSDYARAIAKMYEIITNDLTKVVLGFLLFLCLFQNDVTSNNNGGAKKFYRKTEKFFEMYDTANMKW